MAKIFALHLVVAFIAVLPVRAALVYGNLGADGSTALGSINNDIGPGSGWLAQGFYAGSSTNLSLQSVTLGLFATSSGSTPITISIFSGVLSGTNVVPDSALFTSSPTNVGDKGTYSFAFGNVLLQTNTYYFVVPGGGVSWYYNSGLPAAPLGQNGSGYTYGGTWEIVDTNAVSPVGTWDAAESPRYSLSVYATSSSAVPEPGTWAAAALLAGGAAFVRWRKRAKVS